MTHIPECERQAAACRAARADWVARWPSHCQTCGGQGNHIDLSAMEPCPDCTDRGTCARCGQPGLTSEERGDSSTGDGPCRLCGWNYDDACPMEPECWCDCYVPEETDP